jgi:hypothetical protein
MVYIQSQAKSWIYHTHKMVKQRKLDQASLLDTEFTTELLKHRSVSYGFKPKLSKESILEDRVNSTYLKRYLNPDLNVTNKDLEDSLNLSRLKMEQEVNVQYDLKKLSQAAERVSIASNFPNEKFKPIGIKETVYDHLNRGSGTGYGYIGKKGENLPKIVSDAYKAHRDPTSTMWYWPTLVAYRIQLRAKDHLITPKARIIYPVPGYVTALELSFATPFINHYLNNDTFYAIGDNGGEMSSKLSDRFSDSSKICSLDAKAWDQSILNHLSVSAFSILRQQMKLTVSESKTFENLVGYFCTSYVATKTKKDGAKLYLKKQGIPSGSGFTNLIGTLCHAIIMEYFNPGILSKNKTLICSDDNIFDAENINIDELRSQYKEVFNITVEEQSTEVYDSPDELYFLGFKWINFIRVVNPYLAINQLVYHTDWIKEEEMSLFERVTARAASVLLNGANGAKLFKELFPNLYEMAISDHSVKFAYLVNQAPPLKQVLQSYMPGSKRQWLSLQSHLLHGWQIR